jgi:hypothetical protein
MQKTTNVLVDLNEMRLPSKFHVEGSEGQKIAILHHFEFADFTKNP